MQKEIIEKLKAYFKSKRNVIHERNVLSPDQEGNERFDA